MESLAKLHHRHQPFHLSLNYHCPSFSKPFSSLSFRTPPPPQSPSSSPFKFLSIKASCSSPQSPTSSYDPFRQNPQNPISSLLQTLNPILKTTCITITATAVLFFIRAQPISAIAAPISPPTVESAKEESMDALSLEERERAIEKQLTQNPDDIEALRSLMEVRIKARKLQESINVIDRLIELEPGEPEWPLLKANVHNYSGEYKLAKKEFEEILKKDPFRVEAYHGLVMVTSESGDELKDVLKRIDGAMERCKKENKKSDLRDFKLLVAQINVIQGNYFDALKVYQELTKEEPRDFRPYLCQGIIYTLLRKKDEADKQFQKFQKLVPKNHPYKEYFDDNMLATKLFAQKVERERAGSK